MANYLLELGVEELPAGFVPEAEERLVELLKQSLGQANLNFAEMQSFSTPRRLTAVVKGLADNQESTVKRVKGPPVKTSFDADGQPTAQATGFAAKHNLTVADLKQEDVSGTIFLIAEVKSPARAAREVLPDLVEKIIPQLSGERPMRWGACDLKFNRPLRWVVSLLGADIVSFEIAEIVAGRGLTAAMENDDERRRLLQFGGNKREHAERARIRAKTRGFDQRAGRIRPQVSPIASKAVDCIQLWQASEKFDIIGEGQRQLHGERLFSTPSATDSCCTAK